MGRSLEVYEEIQRNCKTVCSQLQGLLDKVNSGQMMTAKVSHYNLKGISVLSPAYTEQLARTETPTNKLS